MSGRAGSSVEESASLLTVTGWWFILWLWVPLYGQMLAYEVLTPLAAILGFPQLALWFTTYPNGPLLSMLLVCVIAFIYIAIGMKAYARVQKFSFYVGMVGLAIVFVLLLIGNKESFINGLNTNLPQLIWRRSRRRLLCRNNCSRARSRRYIWSVRIGCLPGQLCVDTDDRVLQPVAELGFHPVRRSARRFGLQAQLLGYGSRHHRHRRAGPGFLRADL